MTRASEFAPTRLTATLQRPCAPALDSLAMFPASLLTLVASASWPLPDFSSLQP